MPWGGVTAAIRGKSYGQRAEILRSTVRGSARPAAGVRRRPVGPLGYDARIR